MKGLRSPAGGVTVAGEQSNCPLRPRQISSTPARWPILSYRIATHLFAKH